jgi:hypothetical protein
MIQEITMYTIICDGCKKDVCEGTGYSAWSDAGYVQDVVMEEDWITDDGKHYCADCFEYDDDDNLIIHKGGNK